MRAQLEACAAQRIARERERAENARENRTTVAAARVVVVAVAAVTAAAVACDPLNH